MQIHERRPKSRSIMGNSGLQAGSRGSEGSDYPGKGMAESQCSQSFVQTPVYVHPEESDIFDIGMIALQMITLDGQQEYYDLSNRPKLEFIQFTVSNLDQRGVSFELQTLLQGMLERK